MRKSFIIHIDSLSVLDALTDEQAGALFRAIKTYQETGQCALEGMAMAIFTPFKNQFERDAKKYSAICDRNKNNGLMGGRPKTQNNPVGSTGGHWGPDKPDSKNKNDSKSNKERGTRFALAHIPNDWKEYCQQERPDLNAESVFMEFHDYWVSVPGAKGVKLDWLATWRGWVRRQHSKAKPQKELKGLVV